MIEFNEKDVNMGLIKRESKLFNLQTKYSFRFYGLVNQKNVAIHLSYNYDVVDDDFEANLKLLLAFFETNGISMIVESGGGTDKVCIGIRRDIRDHITLISTLVQTIVYCLEGRMDLKPTKIKGIPAFPSN